MICGKRTNVQPKAQVLHHQSSVETNSFKTYSSAVALFGEKTPYGIILSSTGTLKQMEKIFSWGSVPPWHIGSNRQNSEMELMRKKRGSNQA